jgi:hypothetical protein
MKRIFRHPSPALVISVVAVFFAIGGIGFAAATIGTGDIKNGAVTSKKIKDGTIKQKDMGFNVSGTAGPAGPQGPQGAQGSPGILGLTTVDSPEVSIPPGSNSFAVNPNSLRAQCPSGSTVVGTGFNDGIGDIDFVLKFGTFVGGFVHNDTLITIQARVQAICAQLPQGVSANSARDARAEFEAAQRAAQQRVEAAR